MKILDVVQGSDAWIAARLGRPTASEFHNIITPAKGEFSKSANKYAHGLVVETLLRRPLETKPANIWAMERGKALEPMAREHYSLAADVEVRKVGLVTTDDGRIGASPDSLIVGASGGLEIKCCLDANHMGLFIDGPGDDYKPQVQGSLLVCELEWWDLYGYHPDLPPITIRTYRDESYLAKMGAALAKFLDIRDEMLARAQASGFFQDLVGELELA